MFNIITSSLPSEYLGVKVRIDFKQALKFFMILEDDELQEQEKAILIGKCLFENEIPNDSNLWKFIQYYMSGGEEEESAGGGKSYFSFTQDAGKIYSAFRQIYNIDLRKSEMHWWEFLELFKCLPKGTFLSEVIDIRAREITHDMDSKTKAQLMKLKNVYGLKTKETLNLNWL